MRNDINSYINAIFNDNKRYIAESGCSTIADYIIESAESTNLWNEFFDNKELDGDPTCEQINEFKNYLREYWNDPIACKCYYTYDGKEVFLADPSEMPEDIKPISNEYSVNCQAYELKYWFDYLENNDLDAVEANAHPHMTYFESFADHIADNGAKIVVSKVVNAENDKAFLYDWVLEDEIYEVTDDLKRHGFIEYDGHKISSVKELFEWLTKVGEMGNSVAIVNNAGFTWVTGDDILNLIEVWEHPEDEDYPRLGLYNTDGDGFNHVEYIKKGDEDEEFYDNMSLNEYYDTLYFLKWGWHEIAIYELL